MHAHTHSLLYPPCALNDPFQHTHTHTHTHIHTGPDCNSPCSLTTMFVHTLLMRNQKLRYDSLVCVCLCVCVCRHGPLTTFALGMSALIAGNLVLMLSGTHPMAVFVSCLFLGVHCAVIQGPLLSIVVSLAPPHLKGTAFGMFYTVMAVMTVIANSVYGTVSMRHTRTHTHARAPSCQPTQRAHAHSAEKAGFTNVRVRVCVSRMCVCRCGTPWAPPRPSACQLVGWLYHSLSCHTCCQSH